jgi:hypothetical protein
MGHIRADLAVAGLHPLLQLHQELIDQLRPADGCGRQLPDITARHPVSDRLVITTSELAGVSIALGQVERFEYLHELLGMLHVVPPRGLDD